MSQREKNIALLVILGLLVFTAIMLSLTGEYTVNTIKNKEQFNVRDTTVVDHITIQSKDEFIDLRKEEGTWRLNDQYKAESNIVKVLLSILKDVQVVRNVPRSQQDEIIKLLKEHGFLVEVFGNGELISTFYTSGNYNKTLSYMMSVEENNPLIVNIPGYESYIAGIFEISPNDWRDRVILSTGWRTLQKLEIDYTQYPEHDVTIRFDFNFLKIDGINNLDTARMMSFIDEFNFLQADRYLDKDENEKYDSLLNTSKTVTISIEDINSANSKSIDFYPILPGDPMMLGYVKEDEQRVLFEARRIQDLFAVKSDFEAKPNDHPN